MSTAFLEVRPQNSVEHFAVQFVFSLPTVIPKDPLCVLKISIAHSILFSVEDDDDLIIVRDDDAGGESGIGPGFQIKTGHLYLAIMTGALVAAGNFL